MTKGSNISIMSHEKIYFEGITGRIMDPRVSEDKVPAYDAVESIIKQLDNTVIVFRVFYLLDKFIYKFQLLKKDTMCIVEIPKKMLRDIKNGDMPALQELTVILTSALDNAECWNKVAT